MQRLGQIDNDMEEILRRVKRVPVSIVNVENALVANITHIARSINEQAMSIEDVQDDIPTIVDSVLKSQRTLHFMKLLEGEHVQLGSLRQDQLDELERSVVLQVLGRTALDLLIDQALEGVKLIDGQRVLIKVALLGQQQEEEAA